MNVSLIINTLIAYGILQAFFISYIVLKSKNKTAFKSLFAVLLIVEAITLFERLMVEAELIESAPHLLGISYPISFLKPPIMLFMALAITIKDFKLTKKKYLHFIPFGLMLLFNLPFYFLSGQEKLDFVANFMNRIPSYQSFDFYFSLSFFFYIGIYIFFSLIKLNKFKQSITNNVLVNWYRVVLIGYSAFLVLHLAYYAIQPLGQFNFALVNQISMLATTFIIQSIAFKVMNQSALFNAKTPDLSDIEKRKEQENVILDKFEKDKIYLNDDLSLQKFAESVELPSTEVSKIINQKFNCSFKKLVSQYRVKEAKEMLKQADTDSVKLIDISFQAGFNNKVSFYRAFKEFEQMSPSEYLEKIKNKEKV